MRTRLAVLFRTLMSNLDKWLAKTDLAVATRYRSSCDRPQAREAHLSSAIEAECAQTDDALSTDLAGEDHAARVEPSLARSESSTVPVPSTR
jgi:phosphoenolpyruvate carboxylase